MSPRGAAFVAALEHPRLGVGLALLAFLLVAPSLFIGFHLDDYVHRYLLSSLPGARALERAYESPFGIANGVRAINHWQVEEGYAPYWIDPDLLVSLYRPVSELSHALDAALFPHNAFLQHVHSALWYALLVAAASSLFRALHGRTTIAGLAALLYAFDHTHGFAVGWIANRNAVIAACLGVVALALHHRARAADGALGDRPSAPADAAGWSTSSGAFFLAALLAGEGAIAIAGYLAAHALFLDRAPLAGRARALAPHLVAVIVWRVLYAFFDRGARGSGLYIDPAREPLAFVQAAFERIPVLLLGELFVPPAEAYVFAPAPWPIVQLVLALALAGLLAWAALPLARRDRRAAFWALGALLALVPAVSTHPHNRLLFFVGLGCMGLLSQLWHTILEPPAWLPQGGVYRVLAPLVCALLVGFHLVVSPLLLPLMSISVAFTSPARAAADAILEAAEAPDAANDVVVLTAPDFYYTKLARPIAALEGRTPPRRLRVLSFGAVQVSALRTGDRTLELRYHGGLLREPLLELYRARDRPLAYGTRIELQGMRIEVIELTADGHVAAVRCSFDQPLDAPNLRFLAWDGARLSSVAPPRIGERLELPAARVRFGL